ncbi:hypothetical protein [Shewanella algae]|uniref:hypothetical protein n=1 Tax=Shewanella TaxID=22 RepID=UPI001BF108E2|nr:hypothetical protein [Shewanella algae]BCV47807.1 hypothetical protein TUM17382_05000 [Shewanella algae]
MKPRILNMATYSAGLAALLCLLGQGVQAADSCLNCHSDQAKLQALIKQHQLEKESLSVEQQSLQLLVSQTDMGSHAELGCRDCHSKVDKPGDRTWHPSVLADPSADGGSVCGDCHGEEMITNFRHSLHFTVNGVAKGLMERLQQTPERAQLFEQMHNGEEGCASCHATCGQCHVSAPDFAGGGLLNKHAFVATPDPVKTCETCHYENAEQHKEQDVHVTKHDMSCIDCHSAQQEFHGRDIKQIPEGRLYSEGPNSNKTGPYEQTQKRDIIVVKCEDCHQDKVADHTELLSGKASPIDHNAKLKCTACHTQPYSNCFGCHQDDTLSVGNWQSLKTAETPEQNIKLGLSIANDKNSKLIPLSHSAGISIDAGVKVDLKDPATKSYWVPFSTHFTAKNPLATKQARESGRMCENCHNTDEDIFLKESDLRLGETDPVSESQWIVPKERLPKH